MYFDFQEYRPDTPRLKAVISWRQGVLLSVVFHVLVAATLIVSPRLFPVDEEARRARAEALAEQLARLRQETRFVFVQPLVDRTAPEPPDRADLSDKDRIAQAPERAVQPRNELPFARGNTPERIQEPPAPVARGEGPEPDPAEGEQAPRPPTPEPVPEPAPSQSALQAPLPAPLPQLAANGADGRSALPGGRLGDAFRNLQRYVEMFDNQQGGGGQFGPEIQFDTKGVEFGPWIRRFVTQVRRNWYIPYAAMSMSGHVVIQFNVHRSGVITDLTIVGPSEFAVLNNSAYGALSLSNPTQPLPAAYPADKAFFTVTFFYNEAPQ